MPRRKRSRRALRLERLFGVPRFIDLRMAEAVAITGKELDEFRGNAGVYRMTRIRYVMQSGPLTGPGREWLDDNGVEPVKVGTAMKRNGEVVIQPRNQPSDDLDGDEFYGHQYEAEFEGERAAIFRMFSDITHVEVL